MISQESIGLQIQVQQTAVLLHKVLLSHMGSILLWAIRLCKSLQLCISTSILSSGVFWYVIICYSLFFNWLCSILWSHLYFQEAAVYQLLDLSIVKSWRKVMQSDCLGLLAQCTWSGCWGSLHNGHCGVGPSLVCTTHWQHSEFPAVPFSPVSVTFLFLLISFLFSQAICHAKYIHLHPLVGADNVSRK